jgi:hypothetical protein
MAVRIINLGTNEGERLASRSRRFIPAKSGYDINSRLKEQYLSNYRE